MGEQDNSTQPVAMDGLDLYPRRLEPSPSPSDATWGLPRSTLKRYLDLLELVFMVRRIPAWPSSLTTRAVAVRRLLMVDSVLGAHLIGSTAGRVSDVTAPTGPLLENFALGEIARQITWSDEPARLYRDRDGVGEIVGVEVKAAETVRADDFRGLRHLARHLCDRFVVGFVLYAGAQTLPFGDRISALPLAALWQAPT
ncbi:MAG: DUF4143 domain-containing protein [Egibacteraceae bacterium]